MTDLGSLLSLPPNGKNLSKITKHVRIFYAVGLHPQPIVALKKMACDIGGAFPIITSIGVSRLRVRYN